MQIEFRIQNSSSSEVVWGESQDPRCQDCLATRISNGSDRFRTQIFWMCFGLITIRCCEPFLSILEAPVRSRSWKLLKSVCAMLRKLKFLNFLNLQFLLVVCLLSALPANCSPCNGDSFPGPAPFLARGSCLLLQLVDFKLLHHDVPSKWNFIQNLFARRAKYVRV